MDARLQQQGKLCFCSVLHLSTSELKLKALSISHPARELTALLRFECVINHITVTGCAAGRQGTAGSRRDMHHRSVGFYGLDVYSLSASTQVQLCHAAQAYWCCMQACPDVHFVLLAHRYSLIISPAQQNLVLRQHILVKLEQGSR